MGTGRPPAYSKSRINREKETIARNKKKVNDLIMVKYGFEEKDFLDDEKIEAILREIKIDTILNDGG